MKKFLAMMMVLMMVMTGCGKDAAYTAVTEETEPESTEAVSDISENTETEEKIETQTEDIDSLVTDKGKIDLNLKEYEYSFEDRSVDTSGPYLIPFEKFKPCEEVFYLTGSVDLYIDNGTCVGYTKPDIQVFAIMEYDGWYYIGYGSESKFVKEEDVKANGYTVNTEENTVEGVIPNTNIEQNNVTPVNPVTVTPEIVVPVEETPVEVSSSSNKYTPEEAISVYRSLMEAGGITWSPEIKDVTSWGTGWIYLEKGQPEWCASTNLESFAIGGHGGKSWTKYYLEVTGEDENAVYFTQWHSN